MKINTTLLILLFALVSSCDDSSKVEPVDLGLPPIVSIEVLNTNWTPDLIGFTASANGTGIAISMYDIDHLGRQLDFLSLGITNSTIEWNYLEPISLSNLSTPFELSSRYDKFEDGFSSKKRRWLASKPEFGSIIIESINSLKERIYYNGSFEVILCNGSNLPACLTIKGSFENVQFFKNPDDRTEYFYLLSRTLIN
ncbi:hypothetical protein [Roseivirga sp. UBA1976]|uniref:hypothetical protein n=1 Tax=Roseivirga sp. UBA1976 TaxID=1947386 RepID=UPI00257D2825|nr:hypothetical protein [Roseivirga sp. UBA1976]MEC7754108.1 hypothetical protein [Bacteroidota bacterium]